MRLHLDFETFGTVDLPKEGLARYLRDPSFEVTLTAMAFDDGPVIQWEGFPMALFQRLAAIPDLRWHAFNAPFERGALATYGVEVPLDLWRCTQAHSYSVGFAGRLKDVGAQVMLSAEHMKFADGDRLIHKFAKPAPKNHKVDRYTKENDPAGWRRFMEYNIRDVIAERAIYHIIREWPWTTGHQELWELDQRINARGVPVDVPMATAAVEASERCKKNLDDEIRSLTGGIGGGQTAALLAWLQGQGYGGTDLKAETIDAVLQNNDT